MQHKINSIIFSVRSFQVQFKHQLWTECTNKMIVFISLLNWNILTQCPMCDYLQIRFIKELLFVYCKLNQNQMQCIFATT